MPNFQELYEYPCSSRDSCYPISVSLSPGLYRFELWGGSGGDSGSVFGGRGSFVSGIISLTRRTNFFLFIGASGHLLPATPSFNGGGPAHFLQSSGRKGGSGGGGTDIRFINDSSTSGLLSRIIVSGGGGGSENYYNGINGGFGGSYYGENGIKVIQPGGTPGEISVPTGGTPISGGIGGRCLTLDSGAECPISYSGTYGIFGYGGNATDHYHGGGGGGGYFGGGGGAVSNYVVSSGAGGSSYVSGHPGCQSFATDPDDPLSMQIGSTHYSGLSFSDIIFKDGNETFMSPHGSLEIGHSGGGAIKIKLLGCIYLSFQNCSSHVYSFMLLYMFLSE